jgi:hypothetical protein
MNPLSIGRPPLAVDFRTNEASTLPGFDLAVKPSGIARRRAARQGCRMPSRALAAIVVAVLATQVRAFSPDVTKALDEATYVYVQSQRKSGEWGKPAEIWFFRDGDAVCVGTRPTSWRVKRIKAGRTKARIAVGSPSGPAFEATGSVVHDAALEKRLMEAYAKKYPDRWPQFADDFRKGFESGERVVVRYVPR